MVLLNCGNNIHLVLLLGQVCAEHFRDILSMKYSQQPCEVGPALSLFHRGDNWGLERLGNLLRLRIKSSDSESHDLNFCDAFCLHWPEMQLQGRSETIYSPGLESRPYHGVHQPLTFLANKGAESVIVTATSVCLFLAGAPGQLTEPLNTLSALKCRALG